MNKITNLKQAKLIVEYVGEDYQSKVIEYLDECYFYGTSSESEEQAEVVIKNIALEYAINLANTLYKDKFDELPRYLQRVWSIDATF